MRPRLAAPRTTPPATPLNVPAPRRPLPLPPVIRRKHSVNTPYPAADHSTDDPPEIVATCHQYPAVSPCTGTATGNHTPHRRSQQRLTTRAIPLPPLTTAASRHQGKRPNTPLCQRTNPPQGENHVRDHLPAPPHTPTNDDHLRTTTLWSAPTSAAGRPHPVTTMVTTDPNPGW